MRSHFSSLTRTPKSATPSNRAPQTLQLLLDRASCSALVFVANIPYVRQGGYFCNRVRARSIHLQKRRFSALETQNQDALLRDSCAAIL